MSDGLDEPQSWHTETGQVTNPIDELGYKVCTMCGVRKFAATSFFWIGWAGRYRAQCKLCKAGALTKWRDNHLYYRRKNEVADAMSIFREDHWDDD